MSQNLLSLKSYIPSEFARKPRVVAERHRWRATEFRQFLLYSGPVVLYNLLSEPVYNNFMLLSVAISILASPSLSVKMCCFAKTLLVSFVENFGQLYGDKKLVYNVHGLIHLSDDVQQHGHLDNISGFLFENFLGQIKEMVGSPHFPVAQVIRRISELENSTSDGCSDISHPGKKYHNDGPIPQHVTSAVS